MTHDALVWLTRRSIAMRAAVYLREAARMHRRVPAAFDARALLRQFWSWQDTLKPRRGPLADESAWFTYDALRFMEQILRPDMSVFEWGCGGSTMFFARRVAEGHSVEHDPTWAADVRSALAAAGIAWSLEVVEPERGASRERDPARPEDYASDDEAFRDGSFRAYASAIDRFPDERFDVVVIDGRARPSCGLHAVDKVKRGGWLVLDNADRPYYRSIHERMARRGWPKHSFFGPGPYTFGFWETCAWQRTS